MMPSLVMFDVDKTLARSKQPIEPAMAAGLGNLLARTKVGIISGDPLTVLQENVVERLSADAPIESLYLLPTSGAALYEYKDGEWKKVYEEHIGEDESKHIEEVIRAACASTDLIDLTTSSYGERIEYRGAQVTLSALGQEAPIAEKEAWDTDGSKKRTLRDAIMPQLPQYDVKIGGSTSIDVTKHGVNKAYGVKKISEYLAIPIDEMLYVGDALFAGGNDEVVKESGIATRQVAGPEETAQIIEELVAAE